MKGWYKLAKLTMVQYRLVQTCKIDHGTETADKGPTRIPALYMLKTHVPKVQDGTCPKIEYAGQDLVWPP